ncbi:hypothetical protein PILCRDRAFT_237147 [Piloderma croceum F 1598]|uniref:Uncharacterized protein n=1 Tax=Piloderma croceum (strain F 1598) TaxID=765440 RepID=A0A0C3FX09_PILCF|nr:hypothetical protein PILCRDRAFT_237147 [Piloderma croceum F 1598]
MFVPGSLIPKLCILYSHHFLSVHSKEFEGEVECTRRYRWWTIYTCNAHLYSINFLR